MRDIAAAIILLLVDLPRPLSGKFAIGGDIEVSLCVFVLAVGSKFKVFEDLLLDLLRAGNFILLAHALHHRVIVVLDRMLRRGAVELPRKQRPLTA